MDGSSGSSTDNTLALYQQLQALGLGGSSGGSSNYTDPYALALSQQASWGNVRRVGRGRRRQYMRGARRDVERAVDDYAEQQAALRAQRGLETSPGFIQEDNRNIATTQQQMLDAARNQAYQQQMAQQQAYLQALGVQGQIYNQGNRTVGGGSSNDLSLLQLAASMNNQSTADQNATLDRLIQIYGIANSTT